MKLTKSNFLGCGKVYSFTLKQLVSNRANIITMIISFVAILAIMPMITLFNSSGSSASAEDDFIPPDIVYVNNETDYSPDFSPMDGSIFTATVFEEVTFAADEYEADISNAFIHIYSENNEVIVDVLGHSTITPQLAAYAYGVVDNAKFEAAGAELAQVDALTAPYSISYSSVEDYGSEEDYSMGGYYLQLIYSIITIIVSMYAAAYIVQSVVEEKASKLVESLMISVKPLALILGKILAVMTFVFGMLALNMIAALLSSTINKVVFNGGGITETMTQMGIELSEVRFNPATIAVCVFSLLLGYMTYSLIAGLSGTSCSTMEDIQAANSTSVIIIMGCYLIACVTSAIGSTAVNVITSVIPMLSIFCAPVQYMIGNISFGLLVIAWLLQIIVIAALAWLCAKIYADLIIYSGKPLGFFKMVKMAKQKNLSKEAER